MIEDVRRCGCGEVLVLGDVVSGLDPEGCVRELRALPNVRGVQGNADMYMLTPDLEEWPGRREFPGLVVSGPRLSPGQNGAAAATEGR